VDSFFVPAGLAARTGGRYGSLVLSVVDGDEAFVEPSPIARSGFEGASLISEAGVVPIWKASVVRRCAVSPSVTGAALLAINSQPDLELHRTGQSIERR
jgi:hypothetical protein